MKPLVKISFTEQEYIIMQQALQYYIQTLPISKRVGVRKAVEPLLAGKASFKIHNQSSGLIIHAVKNFHKSCMKKHKLSQSKDNSIHSLLRKINIYKISWKKLHPSGKELQKEFKHVCDLHQHHQDRKALDFLFKDLKFGKKGCYASSCFSGIGLQSLTDFNIHSQGTQFCVIKLLLLGIKATKNQYYVPESLLKQLKYFKKLHKEYLVGKIDKMTNSVYLQPANFSVVDKFLRCAEKFVNEYIKKLPN